MIGQTESCTVQTIYRMAEELRPKPLAVVMVASACLMVACGGCTRNFYRQQADAEVYTTLGEYSVPPVPSIEPGPQSRLFDPFDADRPPLPPDDPAAHTLMHCVDGKRGYRHWHRNGDAGTITASTWMECLPRDESGAVVLDVNGAMQVALSNSRDYQDELEDLYLAAMDVTFQRFRFDTQFFASNSTSFRADGPDRRVTGGDSSSELSSLTNGQLRKLTATGGELVVGLANDLIWEFSGTNTSITRSILDFSLVQPLMRFGGRAWVLEPLTQVERNLLANARQMQQFQQGFLVEIVTGRNSGEGPSRRGFVGASGLGLIAGSPAGRSGAADAGGFWGLLQNKQQILNQKANVAALRDSLDQLEEAFDAGRITNRLQVDQARQALYNGQSSLLVAKAAYQTSVDSFKIELGLPPELEVTIDDPLLDRFNLIDSSLTGLQDHVSAVLIGVRDKDRVTDTGGLLGQLSTLDTLRPSITEQMDNGRRDLASLEANLPVRREHLERLQARPEIEEVEIRPAVYQVEALDERFRKNRTRLSQLDQALATTWADLEKLQNDLPGLDIETARRQCANLTTRLSSLLLELLLVQASARLETVVLVPIEMDPVAGLETARENRLDWMNARARLVDAWRQIEVDANALESDLNIIFEGDIRTNDDNPVRFRSSRGRLRAGVEFDSPLTRLVERNNYRETQIEYQRARRDYVLFEDRISQSLRNTLRIIELSQLNFELRRAAVHVAVSQVDQARFRLNAPPRQGQQAQFGATTARDLVSALTDLLDAQNDFLNAWVNYEVLRMLLDFELGVMQLDQDGNWVDPGPITSTGILPSP